MRDLAFTPAQRQSCRVGVATRPGLTQLYAGAQRQFQNFRWCIHAQGGTSFPTPLEMTRVELSRVWTPVQ